MSRLVYKNPPVIPLPIGTGLLQDPVTGILSADGIAPQPLPGAMLGTDLALISRNTGTAQAPNYLPYYAPPGSFPVSVTTIAASGAAQTLAFPASGNAVYDMTLTGNCVITLSGGTAGQHQVITLYLRQDATAGHTPTLPAGIKWPGGTAPTPNTGAGGLDVFILSTPDGGATVIGGY